MSRASWDLPAAIAAHLAPGTVTEDADPPCFLCEEASATVDTFAGPMCGECAEFHAAWLANSDDLPPFPV